MADDSSPLQAQQGGLNIQQPASPPVLIVTSTRHMRTLSVTESEMQQLQSISGTATIFFTITGSLTTKAVSFFSDYYTLPLADPKSAAAFSSALLWAFFAFVFACGGIYFQTAKHNTVQLIKRESNYPSVETLGIFQHWLNKCAFWKSGAKKKSS